MTGGLMQLVAYGAQDIYLTGNPQITFFKMIYRRHTNFSREYIEQIINGDTGIGNTITAIISRNGDLLHRMYLDLNYATAACRYPNAYASIDEMELIIGGQLIDTHYGDWMHIWSELTTSGDKSILLNDMIKCDTLNCTAKIPLQFWFCRNPGLALPLIALHYHEIKLKITFASASSAGETLSNLNTKLWCEYIYLDTDERRRFAQIPHEYLIEQTQRVHNDTIASSYTDSEYRASLSVHHPVKELIWYVQNSGLTDEGRFNFKRYEGNLTQDATEYDQISTGQLKLNGHDRHAVRNSDYFRLTQRYEHHSGVGMKKQGTHDTIREHTFTSIAHTTTNDTSIFATATVAVGQVAVINLNAATGQSTADVALGIPLGKGSTITFSGNSGVVTLRDDYYKTDESIYGSVATGALANTQSITMIKLVSMKLDHFVSDFDGDMVHVGDTIVISPSNTNAWDSDTSNTAAAASYTVKITRDNYDFNEHRITLTSPLYLPAAHLNGVTATIGVAIRNVILGSKIISDMSWVYCYSFALAPEEHQPSGTCNFSRIDTANLHLGLNTAKNSGGSAVDREIKVYATNYNVLRIMSGMGGLAYDR